MPGTTQRAPSPGEIQAYRLAQSAHDIARHTAAQVSEIKSFFDKQKDDDFAKTITDKVDSGELNPVQASAEIVLHKMKQQIPLPTGTVQSGPVAPPIAPEDAISLQQFGVLSALGLEGNEPGLDRSTPQRMLATGLAIKQARERGAQVGQPTNGVNVNDVRAELARQHGFVAPPRDGGQPAASLAGQFGVDDVRKASLSTARSTSPVQALAALRKTREQMGNPV